jgi:hypothetical protein
MITQILNTAIILLLVVLVTVPATLALALMSPQVVKYAVILSPGRFPGFSVSPACVDSGGTALIDGPSSSYPRVGYRMSLYSTGLSSL